jgi:uncharacterized membrane protein YgcG
MVDSLYDALEICLAALDDGQSIAAVVQRFPQHAAELRPILEASQAAQKLSHITVPREVHLRGRARLLQRAAQLREARHVSARLFPRLPRLAASLGIIVGLIVGGTGLVTASAASLPGDGLYPVKRGWENVQLLTAQGQQARDALQSQFDQQRVDEISELLAQKRVQQVTFSGLITNHADGTWMISGIPVHVSSTTHLDSADISNSMPVTVAGSTKSGGVLEADHIQSLQPGALLPPLEPSENGGNGSTSPGSVSTPAPAQLQTPVTTVAGQPHPTPQSFALKGVVDDMHGTVWLINGQTVYVDQADINGSVDVGSIVKFQGYFDSDGRYIATNVQVDSPGNGRAGNGSSGNGGGKGGGGGNGDGGGDGGGGDDGGGGP